MLLTVMYDSMIQLMFYGISPLHELELSVPNGTGMASQRQPALFKILGVLALQ